MCGFSDVYQRLDSTYYCRKCGKELGRDFDALIAATHGTRSHLYKELKSRSLPVPVPTPPTVSPEYKNDPR